MRTSIAFLVLMFPLTTLAAEPSPEGAGVSPADSRTIGKGRSAAYGIVSYPSLGLGILGGLGDGLDVAGELQLDVRHEFLQLGPWARFSLFDEDGIAFSARFRLAGIVTDVPGERFETSYFILNAAPGVGMSAELAPLTNLTVTAELPFLFFFEFSEVEVQLALTAGVDRYVPRIGGAFGLFVGIAPILTEGIYDDVGFNAGIRGSFAL